MLSIRYMVVSCAFHPSPFGRVNPVATVTLGERPSQRCSAPAPGTNSMCVLPAHRRPRESHLASFMRRCGSGRTGSATVSRPPLQKPKPSATATAKPSSCARGAAAPTIVPSVATCLGSGPRGRSRRARPRGCRPSTAGRCGDRSPGPRRRRPRPRSGGRAAGTRRHRRSVAHRRRPLMSASSRRGMHAALM